jgi:hypothetical protein
MPWWLSYSDVYRDPVEKAGPDPEIVAVRLGVDETCGRPTRTTGADAHATASTTAKSARSAKADGAPGRGSNLIKKLRGGRKSTIPQRISVFGWFI